MSLSPLFYLTGIFCLCSQATGATGFTRLEPESTGIRFTNQLDDRDGARNRTLYNGSGVAVGDIDGDGLTDVYFCGLGNDNALYRNLGNLKFEDVTGKAGIACAFEWSRTCTFADLDGDGDLDLLVGTTGNGVLVFGNNGKGKFENLSSRAGLSSVYASVALALADIDGDGDLDLYVGNNRTEDFRDTGEITFMQNPDGSVFIQDELKDRFQFDENRNIQEYGEPDFLFRNDGTGRFEKISWTSGTFLDEAGNPLSGPPRDWTLTATFRDVDSDGDPDLYTCSDYWTPDRFWINDGKGGFRAAPALALRSTSASSMGVDFGDIDRDGHPDFMVVDMLSRGHQRQKMQMGAMKPTPLALGEITNRPQIMRNTLFHNRGDGSFAEIANFANVAASEWSWQPVFLDVDLDGYEDILVTAGHFRDVQDADTSNKIKELQAKNQLIPESGAFGNSMTRQEKFTEELYQMALLRPILKSPVVAFRNNGGNLTFSETTDTWGTAHEAVHHGIATADFDNDGDLDFVVNDLNSPAAIYRNGTTALRLAVKLQGRMPNSQAIGAKITVTPLEKSKLPVQSREVIAAGRYLSASSPLITFAAASSNTVTITWRDGTVTTKKGVSPGTISISQTAAPAAPVVKPASLVGPLFQAYPLDHVHHENGFDDFAAQPLLPNRLSQLGPGVTFADLDQDGKDDLLIPSGAGGKASSFQGGLKEKRDLAVTPDDQHAALVLGGEPLFTTPPFEAPKPAGLPGHCVSAADIDRDGDLDLFLGSRVMAGRYPEPATSTLMIRGPDGSLAAGQTFAGIGLVTASTFSDLNLDGHQDLILVREWGSPAIFINDGKGHFTDATNSFGFDRFPGWWNSVTTGDFNGDGRPDIVAGNWGRNSKYEHHYDAQHPLTILHRDFDGNGTLDIVESIYDHDMHQNVPVRGLSCSSLAMPFIRIKLPTYASFGAAGIKDIYGGKEADTAAKVSAHHLDHTLFLSRGDQYDAVLLPMEAQLAPVFGIVATDFDNDGNLDLFVAQNFFSSQIETPRIDAGRGLLLKGDGAGGLVPVPASQSGLDIPGDARGAAWGDFDADGRPDLAVTQNAAATKVFQNRLAPPGLRVKVRGSSGNPRGIGISLRPQLANGSLGFRREINAGTGYLSQNTTTQIVAPRPAALVVTLTDGTSRTLPVPPDAKEITIAP